MSKRPEFSKKTKLEAFQRSGGKCEECTAKLSTGNIEYHHIIEATMAVERLAELRNCQVLCRSCHRNITSNRAPVIAKSNRQRNRHIGIKRTGRTLPFGKTSRFKRKITGEIVER